MNPSSVPDRGRIASTIVLLLAIAVASEACADIPLGNPVPKRIPLTPRLQILYHGFVSEAMQEAYDSAFGLQGGLFVWADQAWRITVHGDIALYGASEGEAEIIDDSWTVTKRKTGMFTAEASFTVLYHLVRLDAGKRFVPYVGVGLGGVFGFDQLWFAMSRGLDSYEGHSSLAFRPAFECHALLGLQIDITRELALVAEGQWTQAGKAPLKEFGSSSDEDKAFSDLVHSVIRRPDMNITGWRVGVGIQVRLPASK